MTDRITPEIVYTSGQSVVEVHEIDTSQYAKTSMPKGFARTTPVENIVDPTASDRSS